MIIEKKGTFAIEYDNRIVNVRYYYWALVEGNTAFPTVTIYDRHDKECRFARRPELSKWTCGRQGNKWPLGFRKKLAIELEKLHSETAEQVSKYDKPSFSPQKFDWRQ